jgi:hypothetical protein
MNNNFLKSFWKRYGDHIDFGRNKVPSTSASRSIFRDITNKKNKRKKKRKSVKKQKKVKKKKKQKNVKKKKKQKKVKNKKYSVEKQTSLPKPSIVRSPRVPCTIRETSTADCISSGNRYCEFIQDLETRLERLRQDLQSAIHQADGNGCLLAEYLQECKIFQTELQKDVAAERFERLERHKTKVEFIEKEVKEIMRI